MTKIISSRIVSIWLQKSCSYRNQVNQDRPDSVATIYLLEAAGKAVALYAAVYASDFALVLISISSVGDAKSSPKSWMDEFHMTSVGCSVQSMPFVRSSMLLFSSSVNSDRRYQTSCFASPTLPLDRPTVRLTQMKG